MNNTPSIGWQLTADAFLQDDDGAIQKVPMTSVVILPNDNIEKEYNKFVGTLSVKMGQHPLDMSKAKCPERDEYLSSNALQQ